MKKTLRIRMEADIEIEDKPDSLLEFTTEVIQNLRSDVKDLIEKAAEDNTDSPIKCVSVKTGGMTQSFEKKIAETMAETATK